MPNVLPMYKKIAATDAGTTVLLNRPGYLHSIIIPALKTGTASFYDTATAAGTTAGNLLYDLPNTVGTIPTAIPLEHTVKSGCVVITGGTVDFTVTYQ